MKKIFSRVKMCIVLLVLACPLLLNGGDLSMYCLGTPCASPSEGEEWESGMLPLVIRQVLTKGGGSLVCVDPNYIRDSHGTPRLVFVKMPVLGMVDGNHLPKTIYRCIGTFSYANSLGSEATIPAFEELSQAELLKIQKAEEDMKKAVEKAEEMWACKMEAVLRTVSERMKESELADQAAREAYAKVLLADKTFGIADRILVESCVSDSIVCKEKDYRVGRMEKFRAESKWLDLLNLICEMHESNEYRSKSFFSQLPTAEMQRQIKEFGGNSIAKAKQEIAMEAGVATDGKEIVVCREIEERILSDWRSGLESSGKFERYPDIEQILYIVSSLSNIVVFAEIGIAEECQKKTDFANSLEISRLFCGWDCMPVGGQRQAMSRSSRRSRRLGIRDRGWKFLEKWENCLGTGDYIYSGHPSGVEYVLCDTNTVCMIARSKTRMALSAIGDKICGYIGQVEAHEIPPEEGELAFKKACQEVSKFIADNYVKLGGRGVVSRHPANAMSALRVGVAAGRIPSAEVNKDKELLTKTIAGITVPASTKGNPQVRKIVKMMRDPTVARIYAKYTGKSCEDEIAAFKSEWEGVSATPSAQLGDPNEGNKDKEREINDRIVELKDLCHIWKVRKSALSQTPQVVRDAEKEIKDLQNQLRKLKTTQDVARFQAKKNASQEIEDKRSAILKKYHDMITDDLMAVMDAVNQ